MRTDIVKALRLIPGRLLSCADIIRQIRNEFAHNIEIDSFDKVKPELISSLRGHLAEYNRDAVTEESLAEIFRSVVFFTVTALQAYSFHTTRMNEFIRSEEFIGVLKEYVVRTTPS